MIHESTVVLYHGSAHMNLTETRFQIWYSGTGQLWISDVHVAPMADPTQGRWLEGLYLDVPEEWDDPYRFFRW